MTVLFQEILKNTTGHKAIRQKYADKIIENPELFPELVHICFQFTDKNTPKACWILELVLAEKPHLLFPFLDFFCNSISKFTNESAIRSISKICMFLSKHLTLTAAQEQKIVESCFDWLIFENGRVANKAYSIRALFEFGKKTEWIYPELQAILTNDYMKYSAAYKAVAREILKKIK